VPHVGTWIEIVVSDGVRDIDVVVPHVGTWIEMYESCRGDAVVGSCLT